MRFVLPLGIFSILVVFLGLGLSLDPRHVPSPLIGKPIPDFNLQSVSMPAQDITDEDLRGRVFLLNVWASWCAACIAEHPLLVELAESGAVDIVGLNYKDTREHATAWLRRNGDPYRLSLRDPVGDLGLDLGVYGVPETFLIDAEGIIRYKHIGPLNSRELTSTLLPLLTKLDVTSS
jgi:cytochrome c biogenesis protein CcmG/thiol:disulfide interchange protein DsbE